MLTAFNYYEPEEENRIQKGIKHNRFFDEEVSIAKRYLDTNCSNNDDIKECIACGSKNLKDFYKKWEVDYLRCNDCYSIMANVSTSIVRGYKESIELNTLISSDDYQNDGREKRYQKWDDLLDWVSFRSFRYLGYNKNLKIIDYGTKWNGQKEMFEKSELCGEFHSCSYRADLKDRDLALAIDFMQSETNPKEFLTNVNNSLKKNGLLMLSTKVGSGVDILTLKGNNKNVFPCEHIFMPSKEGLRKLLEECGFELLEFTTPGTFDVNFLMDNIDNISDDECFLNYFLKTANPGSKSDFQRFLQKAGLSSYAQIIAKKK